MPFCLNASLQYWKSENLNQFHNCECIVLLLSYTSSMPPQTESHSLSPFPPPSHTHWFIHMTTCTDQPKSIMSSTVAEHIMVDVTGHIHKGGWQRILIVSCSCLVALLFPVILLLQMSHLLLAWQAPAVLMVTAAMCSSLGNLSGPQQQEGWLLL